MVGGVWLIDAEATGLLGFLAGLGMLVFVVLSIVACFGGLLLWMWIEQAWDRWRGHQFFDASTTLRMDSQGFCVEGLGTVAWPDVLALEGVPDSDSALIVHTRPFSGLLLQHDVDALLPVLQHYMGLCEQQMRQDCANDAPQQGQVKALPFYWPGFLVWVGAGYVAAGAVWFALVLGSNRGVVGTVLGGLVLAVMVAWLVWAIPFAQLSTFSPKRIRAFALEGTQLASTDGRWRWDLRTCRVRYRHKRGVGFNLSFVSIRPAKGRGLDLLLEPADMTWLVQRLQAMSLIEDAEMFVRRD